MRSLLSSISAYIEGLDTCAISLNRRAQLQQIADYLIGKKESGDKAILNFICVHNSRRSQFFQLWFSVLASHLRLEEIKSVSSGSEVTRVHPNVLKTLRDIGFTIKTPSDESTNPHIEVVYTDYGTSTTLYSKLFDELDLATETYAAILNCMEAEVKCPVIPDPEIRILLPLQDPGKFDGTGQESEAYHVTSRQIATEVLWVLKKIDV